MTPTNSNTMTDIDSSTASSPLSSPPESPPSSPLTEFSTSPSPPPPDYRHRTSDMSSYLPSPPASQQTSQNGSPTPDGLESGTSTDKEGQPPRKRRRISRERTTEFLDLRNGEVADDQQAELDRLLHVLHKRQKIVVIAGAGISVSAGIPDFRSSTGLFRSLKEEHKLKGSGKHLFDASVYKDDTSTSSFHTMVSSMSRLTKDAKPTAFHHMLATIAKEDRLLRLYSQNVDGIDTGLEPLKTRVPLNKDEDGKWPRTVQLHGGLGKMVCSKCHELSDFDADLFSGPTPPLCPRCEEIDDIRTVHEGKRSHGIGRLRPRMVLYNEHNPDDLAIGSVTRDDLRRRPDAVIVVGTTLKVPGVRRIVREMCGVVRDRRDGEAIWINNDLPPVSKDLEDCFDIIVQSPCDEVAVRAAMRKWDEPADDFSFVSDEESLAASKKKVEVLIPTITAESQETRETAHEFRHLKAVELPSERHVNNSFLPPPVDATPKKAITHPEDWSPITDHRSKVMSSIETAGSGMDSIAVQDSGLLTPTKSQKTWITENEKKPSLLDQLQNKPAKITPASGKPKAPATKKRPSQAPKTAKPPIAAPAQKGGLLANFKQTKSAALAARSESKKSPQAPSNLCHVFSVSEPMQPVSPNSVPQKTPPDTAAMSSSDAQPASKQISPAPRVSAFVGFVTHTQ